MKVTEGVPQLAAVVCVYGPGRGVCCAVILVAVSVVGVFTAQFGFVSGWMHCCFVCECYRGRVVAYRSC